jgi:quinol monooxygenase YgiN
MIIISGTISFDPSDHDAAVALMGPLVEATLSEDGCNTYGFWASTTEAGVFRAYEEWENEDALNAHMGAAHMAEFIGAIGSLKVTGTSINRYDVSNTTKFM